MPPLTAAHALAAAAGVALVVISSVVADSVILGVLLSALVGGPIYLIGRNTDTA